jgi:adenylate kinase
MNLLIMGAPGTGKGTMSNIITKEFEVVHVSTGDMLRASIANGSPVGLEAQNYMNSGKLVPDSIIHDIIVERLGQKDMDAGFLMDGYPRTLEQAKDLSLILDEVGKKIDLVINLYVDDEVLKERITGRRLCKKCGAIYHTKNSPAKVEGICDVCGSELYTRKDDTLESLVTRLNEYYGNTKPVLDYYKEQNLVVEINADQAVEAVFAEVAKAIESVKHD